MEDANDDTVDTSLLVHQLSADGDTQRRACEALMWRLQQGEATAAQLLQMDCVTPLLFTIQQQQRPAPATPTLAAAPASAPASASSTVAAAAAAATASPAVLAARRLLHQLQLDSKMRLFEAGWNVSVDARSGGAVRYRCAATKEERCLPPPLPASADPEAQGEPEWVASLLAELPLLCTPMRRSGPGAAEEEEWPARVRAHRPRSLSGSQAALSVIDVRPELEGGGSVGAAVAALPSSSPSPSQSGADGVSRQLILGTWQGVGCSFRETEADLSYPPGSHLESWYTVTLAGVGMLATAATAATSEFATPAAASSTAAAAADANAVGAATDASLDLDSRPSVRVLVIGLGGGALVSFLAHHAPHWRLDVVELSAQVAATAEQWFGVRFEHSLQPQQQQQQPAQQGDAAAKASPTPSDLALTAGFVSPSVGPPCRLHVMDAFDFVRSSDPGCFDLVLLDVYTSGVFPPPLLESDFFRQIKRVLQPAGTLLVNAGVGADRARVTQCASEAFGVSQCRMLLDRKTAVAQCHSSAVEAASSSSSSSSTSSAAASASSSSALAAATAAAAAVSESQQENGVVLCGSVVSDFRDRFNTVAWRKRVVERHPSHLPPLPFELASMLTDTTLGAEAASSPPSSAPSLPLLQSTHVAWRGVQFDKLAARQSKQQQKLQQKTSNSSSSSASAPALKPASKVCCSKEDAAWSLFD